MLMLGGDGKQTIYAEERCNETNKKGFVMIQ